MASSIFLDANILMRLMENELSVEVQHKIDQHSLYLSALSIHIATYIHKIKLPDDQFSLLCTHFLIEPITKNIINESLLGPTSDFEDNIQLNTAHQKNISFFITMDEELLKRKKFHQVKIISPNQL